MDVISLSSDSSGPSSPSSICIDQSEGSNNCDFVSSLNIENSLGYEIPLKNNSSTGSPKALNLDNQLLSRIVHSLSDSNESDCEISGVNDHLQTTRLQAKYGHERNKAVTSHLNLPSINKPCTGTSLGMVS